jgi:DNA adenine methylase
LNKTCFRGLYRVGPNGFNVPFGHYKKPEIVNRQHLMEVHELVQGVVFESVDYLISISQIEDGDFIYIDPPYVPELKTSFVNYTVDGFGLESHKKLFLKLNELSSYWLMSNSDVELVRKSFPETRYTIDEIICKRAINCNKPNMVAKELLIRNI